MGCYDTVTAPCPKCGEQVEFQSKSGECLLRVYPLAEAPTLVLENVNRHAPLGCSNCGSKLMVAVDDWLFCRPGTRRVVIVQDNAEREQ